ncbi:lysine-rich coiled-coil protein 1 isoform X2 [Mixophyes fleayi]|uniref:lysine-rich coiled-coil protein 1 isoform X2 n=1 Tax=Mixophyes fleayi TaxID=3061075 RepID=UPI003F4DCD1D
MASEGAMIIPQLVESITQSSSPCSVPMAGGDISSSAHTTIPCLTDIILDEKTKKELFTDTFCRVCGAVLQFESHKNAHYEGKKHAQRVRLYFLKQELEEMTYKKQKVDRVDFHVDQGLAQDKNKFCSLCNMVFSSPVVAQSHYLGKIHAKKLKQMSGEQLVSEVDDPSLDSQKETVVPPVSEPSPVVPPLSEKCNQQEASAEQPPSSANNEIDLSDPNKYCKLCCASFNNPLVAQQHYNGKKHARNEARRRMMEEMEDTEDAMDTGASDGMYTCPICNVSLTSIEMYKSHMQGNKHQIKRNMVANLMNTTKKTFASFEEELEDYIKVQRARGLEPKTMLRQDRDHYDSGEETDPVPAPVHPKANPYKYYPHHPMSYPVYHSPHPADPRVAGWEKGCWPQKPTMRIPGKTGPHRKRPPSSPDSSDYSSSSDESSDSYKKERRHRREHRNKESRYHSKTRRENESSEWKKRKIEEANSGKDNSDREKRAEESPVDKSKHRKDKKKKEEQPIDKDGKKHKKTRKPEDQRTEEELLWDESILGF